MTFVECLEELAKCSCETHVRNICVGCTAQMALNRIKSLEEENEKMKKDIEWLEDHVTA